MAIAAATIAADLIQTAKFGTAAAYANLDRFAKAFAPRGVGTADDRLSTLAPWYAAVGGASSVGFDQSDRLVSHESWFRERLSVDE